MGIQYLPIYIQIFWLSIGINNFISENEFSLRESIVRGNVVVYRCNERDSSMASEFFSFFSKGQTLFFFLGRNVFFSYVCQELTPEFQCEPDKAQSPSEGSAFHLAIEL